MKICLAILCLLLALPAAAETLEYGPFGTLIVRGNAATCSQVAVLLSSASGWGATEERMSAELTGQGVLVVGVDVGHYLREINQMEDEQNISCDLESLSKYVQKHLAVPHLHTPILVGHADGATIVYASLVQAPARTFLGGVAIGFRPDLKLVHPFGVGRGLAWKKTATGLHFTPVHDFPLDLTIIQAEKDPVFAAAAANTFLRGIPDVRTVVLPRAATYADNAWVEPLGDAVQDMAARATRIKKAGAIEDLNELPLVEVPATKASDIFAIFISGDGGWAGLDKEISEELSTHGVSVVGIDALKYFWTRRTSEEGGQDLARIINHYSKVWGKKKVLLIGYSLGADALGPFAANLPADLRSRVALAVLLSPGRNAELEFHVADWFDSDDEPQGFPLLPVIKRLSGMPILCLHGDEDTEGLCPLLDKMSGVTVTQLPGGHHFDDDYETVSHLILSQIGLASKDQRPRPAN